jgi:hypothetical protein
VVLDQTNSWQPGQRGSSTPAQAAFGVTATSGSGIGLFREVAALRNLAFVISSPAVTFDNGQFDSTSLGLVIPAMTEAVLDFQVEHLVAIAGSRQLDGLNGSNTAAEATVSLLAEVQTLSIPVDLSLTCQTVVTNDTRLRFTGRVVARRGVMLLRPELLWVASPTDRQELTLVWASSYRLEHATTLSPPDWTAYADAAPVTVIAQGAMGFYRVVAKP